MLDNKGKGMMQDSNKKQRAKHKIGWCSNCGFVHGIVKPYTMVENGHIVIKPICTQCRAKERERERMIVCAVCGLKKGEELFPTTIERLTFDGVNTCNFIVTLCKECRQKPHAEIRKQLNARMQNMCEECSDRFKCYTAKHGRPVESIPDRRGFHMNPRIKKRKWWWL